MTDKIDRGAIAMEAFHQAQQLSQDIEDIMRLEKMSRTALARELGVNRKQLWIWQKRRAYPTLPVLAFYLSSWAKRLRELQSS